MDLDLGANFGKDSSRNGDIGSRQTNFKYRYTKFRVQYLDGSVRVFIVLTSINKPNN